MTSATHDLLQQVIEPVVASEGLDLEQLELAQAGRRSRLRIVVDADGGVDLDRCAEVSRSISRALDDSDVLGDRPYTLEVSSPGVARPLTLRRHWSRAAGRLVRAVLHEGDDVVGRVVSAGEQSAVLDVDGVSRELAYADVRRAKVQVEFRKTGEGDLDDFEEEG